MGHAIIIGRLPHLSTWSSYGQRCIFQQSGNCIATAIIQGGKINRWFNQRTDWTNSVQSSIEAGKFWVSSTNHGQHLATFDSMLGAAVDPRQVPELLGLRERIRSWRFYDHFRSDAEAPARRPQIGTHTPVLGADGADLAAALQTIREIGDAAALDEAVDDAFPGSRLHIDNPGGRFEVLIEQPGRACGYSRDGFIDMDAAIAKAKVESRKDARGISPR